MCPLRVLSESVLGLGYERMGELFCYPSRDIVVMGSPGWYWCRDIWPTGISPTVSSGAAEMR